MTGGGIGDGAVCCCGVATMAAVAVATPIRFRLVMRNLRVLLSLIVDSAAAELMVASCMRSVFVVCICDGATVAAGCSMPASRCFVRVISTRFRVAFTTIVWVVALRSLRSLGNLIRLTIRRNLRSRALSVRFLSLCIMSLDKFCTLFASGASLRLMRRGRGR